jgi:antitoxin component YwqK of YwqJK toxin-antitoxin module
MNPLRLLVLLVSLPLLLGGCGEKPVAEVKPVEEKVLEVKEEVKPEEPVAEAKPELEGVNEEEIEEREGIIYLNGSDTPYTGKVFMLYAKGQKKSETNVKDGKPDGLWVRWHKNGQKKSESNYKDGVEISVKYWNSKGVEGVNVEELEQREGIYYLVGSDTPYTGKVFMLYAKGQKAEANFKDGKLDGLAVRWHENGQKAEEVKFKDGKIISTKYWNSKGEPVDTYEEAFAE